MHDPKYKQAWDQWTRFNAKLPELLKRLPDRWVVFREGSVQGDYSSEDEAYSTAVGRYGPDGGFIVSRVTDKPAVILFGRT